VDTRVLEGSIRLGGGVAAVAAAVAVDAVGAEAGMAAPGTRARLKVAPSGSAATKEPRSLKLQ
jgi:hypothetical protein